MAEHNYTLTIQMSSDGGSQSPIAGQSNQTQETPSEGGFTAQTAVEALVSFKTFVEPLVQPVVDGYIQTISLRTGSQEAQDRIQFAYNVGGRVKNLAKNIIIGARVGSLPGAIAGAAASIFSTVINYAVESKRLSYEQSLESISLRGMNVRAGGYAPSYAGSRSRAQ